MRAQSAALGLLLAAACARHAPDPPRLEPERRVVPPQRRSMNALTRTERDSLLNDLARQREQWKAHHITDYQIKIVVQCFCPWPSHPAIVEVRQGVVVALRDTTGKTMGKPREPWAIYTVDGLFNAVERTVQGSDVVQVAYDPQYGYPAVINSDLKIGLPDDWFVVRASRLTPSPR